MFSILKFPYARLFVVGLGGFALGAVVLFLYSQFNSNQSADMQEGNNWFSVLGNEVEIIEESTVKEEVELIPAKLMVDVKGEVHRPGLYELVEGQRVLDAIESAGGITEHGSATLLNYAQIVTDEMVIYVPAHDEEDVMPVFPQTQQGQGGSQKGSGKVNINTALEGELTQLPGIGPAKANAIIQHREEHGLFQSVEELTNVSGIGEKTLGNLIEHITAP